MKLLAISILAILTFSLGSAQEFKTETSRPFKKENIKDIYHIVFPSAYGFMTVHHLDNVMMDNTKAMVLTKYDQSMQSIETKTFNLPKLGQRASDLQKLIELDNRLIFLSTVMDKQLASHQVNAQVYNQKDNSVSDNKVLASFTIDGYGKSGYYQLAVSPDQSKIAIVANMPFEKKTQEQVKIWVYDNQLNLLWEQSETLKYESDRVYQEETFVLNSGEVIIHKLTDAYKKTRLSELLTFNSKSVETTTFSSEGFQPMDTRLIDLNGVPMLIGFYWDGRNNVVEFNSAEGDENNGAFIYDVNAKRISGIHEWSKNLNAKDLKSLKVVGVKILNDDVFMIGERQLTKSAFRKSGTTVINELDDTHTFGSSIIVNLDARGTLKSFTPLFNAMQYVNEAKEKGSLAALYLENGLRVFSNNQSTIGYYEFFSDKKATFYHPQVRPYDNSTSTTPYLLPATVRPVVNYGIVYYMTTYGDQYWFNKMTW
jgi:hypothetical protein